MNNIYFIRTRFINCIKIRFITEVFKHNLIKIRCSESAIAFQQYLIQNI